MNILKEKIVFRAFAALMLLIAACKPELKELKFDNKGADFTKYVALGSSYTAGYQNNALCETGQQQSFAAILANQFKMVGGGSFKQPLVPGNNGAGFNFYLKTFIPQLTLGYGQTCNGKSDFRTSNNAITDITSVENYIGGEAPFNNMGVPGMKATNLDNADFGSLDLQLSKNPFYSRFATIPENSTVLTDATRQLPTFFTFWVGMNDIYDCAMAGYNQTLATITPLTVFQNVITNALTSLTAGNRHGAVANIPDILDLPYFTTVPYNALELTQEQADTLNLLYASNVPAIQFAAGRNALVISDTLALPSMKRQMKPDEMVLLTVPFDSINCAGWGSNTQKPLGNRFVLTTNEINSIRQAINSYNSFLKTKATENNLAYVDIYSLFKNLNSGITFNGVKFTNAFLKGNFFSLDGITPTGKGNAIIANEFIKAINEKYGTQVPSADVNNYTGTIFP
ncbi:MAG: SGNH/GDSL hydrolase family protein [Bacteroidetes bacterium]|jgi:hypothetical protein|nr:SGNH/GDSL hydrolase family protein [Bacteroidota bacterium]